MSDAKVDETPRTDALNRRHNGAHYFRGSTWYGEMLLHARQLEAELAEAKRDALTKAADTVPTNWLDPLLTGPTAVIPAGCSQVTPRDLEALLRGIQDRIRALRDSAMQDGEQERRG